MVVVRTIGSIAFVVFAFVENSSHDVGDADQCQGND